MKVRPVEDARERRANPAQKSIVGNFTWHDLVSGNPMLAELHRFRRRYLSFGKGKTTNNLLGGAALASLVMLMVAVSSDGMRFPAITYLYIQTAIIAFLVPIFFHGAIAKERERRTWEILLVAPVTKAQIVAGKMVSAVAMLGMVAAAFLTPLLVAFVRQDTSYFNNPRLTLTGLLFGEGISLSFGLFIAALTLFFSARVRRPFTALGAVLGLLVAVIMVIPAIAGTTAAVGDLSFFTGLINPFIALGFMSDNPFTSAIEAGPLIVLTYLGLAATFFLWTVKTLTFAENSVRFLPQVKESDAVA